jgi:hypothetical protein
MVIPNVLKNIFTHASFWFPIAHKIISIKGLKSDISSALEGGNNFYLTTDKCSFASCKEFRFLTLKLHITLKGSIIFDKQT